MEIWKEIEGYEGLYEVSNTGKVRSLDRYTTGNRHRLLKGKELSQRENELGYKFVQLCKDGIPKHARVHRLVAQAFIQNPEKKPYINHIDANPKNNNVDNLEWCTQQENIQHAYKMGCFPKQTKLTKEQVDYIRDSYIPYKHSAQNIADELNISIDTVYGVLKKRRRYMREGLFD